LTGRADALNRPPETAWTPAYDGDGEPRDGADVAELTAEPDRMAGVRPRHRPPRSAAPRRAAPAVECNGRRITCFATNTSGGQLPDLKRRHRRRARAEDRIRWVKDIGLANLPLHDAASNAVWLASFSSPATCSPGPRRCRYPCRSRVAEPKTLRLRWLPSPGDRIRAANPATAGPALALGRHGGRRRSGATRLSRPRLTTPLLPRRPEDPEQRPGATGGNITPEHDHR
jgi:hypothetical protein